jgi:hypothetical protein
MKTKFVFAGILGMALLAMAAPRTWTFKQDGTFEGDYYSSGTSSVVIRKDGTNKIFQIADLSTNDQAYIAKIKADQKQARLDAEVKQMLSQPGWMEFTTKLIENFPEKVDDHNGWMDCKFAQLDSQWVNDHVELGFFVYDKEDDLYQFCFAPKVFLPAQISNADELSNLPTNPLIPVISSLKRGDKVRLIGKVVNGTLFSSRRLFHVLKVEMIESAAEKKAREQAAENP